MARLNENEIKEILEEKGFKPIDISEYKNVKSEIIIECDKGHKIQTTMETFKKKNFCCPNCQGIATNDIQEKIPDKENKYRIVAFDQASQKIGVSIYDDGKLVFYTLIQVSGDLDVRLNKIYRFIDTTVIPFWQPDYLIFEDIQLQNDNVQTFKILSMVLGTCISVAAKHNIPHTEIFNKVWQQKFNIKGVSRAEQKQAVIDTVKKYYNIDVTDDVADAILLGHFATTKLESNWLKSDF